MNMLRRWDRLVKMQDDRITEKILCWGCANSHVLNSDVKRVFEQLNLLDMYTPKSLSNLLLDNVLRHS
ncbi:hypothetical protein DPMN_156369 [Dreissena polymorpha]|uniref:Uncharacterized protein n=1 Tax=Dreissena polymorpha TaxID=45954 RepID=A0A9D4FPQ3_DREPO|nr:hypothetical protein DPMN_156369 [Dreissena polymorpha]